MPHPPCDVAEGWMVYSIPLIIFEDDILGNHLKQWNKHYSCYMSNGALPCTKLDNEFCVRFIATSPHAMPLEIMQGIWTSIEYMTTCPCLFHCWYWFKIGKHLRGTHIKAWDCMNMEEVLLHPYALFFPGDNPMQVEMASSTGLSSNHFCCTCKAGSTCNFKQSNEGLESLFKVAKICHLICHILIVIMNRLTRSVAAQKQLSLLQGSSSQHFSHQL